MNAVCSVALATDQRSPIPLPGSTAAFLSEKRDEILKAFVDEIRNQIPWAKNQRLPILVNTIPAFIENLVESLTPTHSRGLASEDTSIAAEHGSERARVTAYSPEDLIREYQVLRNVLLGFLKKEDRLSKYEEEVVIKSIDQAMGESLMAYFLVHESLRHQFTMTLTHDLRNPLSNIKSASELLQKSPDRSEQVVALSNRISESVQRIDRMIQDLLDASRVQFGELNHYEVSELELLDLVRGTVAEFAHVHGNRFILIGNPIRGYWNPVAYKRALENLLENAIKYGDPASPIRIEVREHLGRAILSVHNDGSSISVEEQAHLFKPFVRAGSAESRKRRGWGIGLAMARGMAEGHAGSITVDSSPDRGTTFIIDTPVDPRPEMARHGVR